MRIKVFGISGGGGRETEFREVSDFVGDVKVRSAAKECTRGLDFKILRGDFDVTLPNNGVNLGDAIVAFEVDEETGAIIEEIFTGVVWTIKRNDNDPAIYVTCYDKAIYLNKNEPETQVFEQMRPDEVAKIIITELGLPVGKLATGAVDDYNLRNKNGYDGIMQAYTQESEKSGRKFKIVFEEGVVNVYEVEEELLDVVIEELDEPVVGKLLNTDFTESLDDMVTSVTVIEDEEMDKKESAIVETDYGSVQKIKKGKEGEVNDLLQPPKKVVDVECIGSWAMKTGKSIFLNSSIISGEFYITADEHILNDGVHTCNLSLSDVYEM